MQSLRDRDRRRDIDIYYNLHLLKMSFANLMQYVIRIPNPWNRSFFFALKISIIAKWQNGIKICLLFRMFYFDSNVILPLLTDMRVRICPPFLLLFAKKQLIRNIFMFGSVLYHVTTGQITNISTCSKSEAPNKRWNS